MPEYVCATAPKAFTNHDDNYRPIVQPHPDTEASMVQESPTPISFPLPPMKDVIASRYVVGVTKIFWDADPTSVL